LTWEERNSTEPKKNSMNNPTKDPNDITKETVNESTPNQCNDIGNVSGIYKIVNKVNGNYYVGSTKNFNNRWRRKHRKQLRGNYHTNLRLQRAWNKYGENAFEFQIIEEVVEISSLYPTEQKYLDIAKTEQDKCYNLKFVAEGFGCWSQESIDRFKEKMKSSEVRRKISESSRKRKPRLGIPCSEEAKKKIGEKNKKRYSDPTVNPNYDKNVYEFINEKTGESFTGTKYDFYHSVSSVTENIARYLVKEFRLGRVVLSLKGWKIKSRLNSHQSI
jgi:group I intron endonuclease